DYYCQSADSSGNQILF
nr:immunoglobulin light chain junction region [Macaca mulatta]MOX42854.1 immunoglobulin light chain junction region [Macaca mulatta]MOX44137.1 immunoglobulin light chain junction region [Macaca mulatta]